MAHFKSKSIKEQMRQIVIYTIFLFILLCAFISYCTKQQIYNTANEHKEITAIRLKDQINLLYDKINNFYISIGENASVCRALGGSYAELSGAMPEAKESLTQYQILEPAIVDISLVNDKIHYSTVYGHESLDKFRKEAEGDIFGWKGVVPHDFEADKKKPNMMVYTGNIIQNSINIGTVVISVDLGCLLLDGEGETNSSYFLADKEGGIYPLNCSQKEASDICRIWEKSGGVGEMKHMPYYIHAYDFSHMDCLLIAALNVRNMQTGMGQIQLLIWICVILAVLFCVIFLLIINRGLVQPLNELEGAIRTIREKRQRRLKEKLSLQGCREITEIGNEFSEMLQDIDSLNRKILQSATDLYELKVQKQEAELAYLRSQIDPHFLYNTLEMIRKMAMEREAPEIARMITDMGNIFRYSTKGNPEVTLEQELSIVQSYIRIQKKRFSGKIEVFYFIPDEAACVPVMKMLLQPIVENAVFHGLEPKKGEGSLYIGVQKEQDTLKITVTDDGIGMPAEQLKRMQEKLLEENVDTSEHVGILNTNARIRLQYGKRYGLTLESCEGDGTTVIMTLPAGPKKQPRDI